MITEEACKRWHGKELRMTIPNLRKFHNCVILASVELGVSFKPYPKTDEEEHILIDDIQETVNCSFETAKMMYKDPTFCFAYAKTAANVDDVDNYIKALNNGYASDFWERGKVVCPYAY